MMQKIHKYFFYLFFFVFFTIIIFVTFNSKFRAQTLHYLINSYKVYMIVSVQAQLKSENRDLLSIEKKLLNFINFSNKFSNGKNKLLIGIYDAANLVQKSLNHNQDFSFFEKSFSEIVKLDSELYEAKLWYAKALYANNKIDEAFYQINKAIELSSLDDKPYRLAIEMAAEQKKTKLKNFYCSKYSTSELGGKQKRYTSTLHSGFNINKFGISFNSNDKNIYTSTGIDLGKYNIYEIIPEQSKDIDSLKLFFTFLPGTSVDLKKITFQSGATTTIVDQKGMEITSNSSFFLNTSLQKTIIFTEENDEIIKIHFKQKYKNVDKVLIEMRVKKLDITNIDCENIIK